MPFDNEDEDEKFVLADDVQEVAKRLIPNYHPELATARIQYLFVAKTPKKGGREVMGKASKVSGRWEYLTDLDFILEVPRPLWRTLDDAKRRALVDSLLERCTAQENDQTGALKWVMREPDTSEFSTILQRHGAWNETLTGFVTVAQSIELNSILDETLSNSMTEDLTVEETEV